MLRGSRTTIVTPSITSLYSPVPSEHQKVPRSMQGSLRYSAFHLFSRWCRQGIYLRFWQPRIACCAFHNRDSRRLGTTSTSSPVGRTCGIRKNLPPQIHHSKPHGLPLTGTKQELPLARLPAADRIAAGVKARVSPARITGITILMRFPPVPAIYCCPVA